MRIATSALALLLSLVARQADAHHPGPNPTPQLPRSRVALDLEAAEFEVLGDGYWRQAALTLEHTLFGLASIGARIPLAHIDYADGHDAFGPGDIDVGARVMVFQSYHEDFALILGLGFELPTGNVDDGLGGGHFMVTPSIAASYRMHRSFMLSLVASDHIPTTSGDEPVDTDTPGVTTQHTNDPPPLPTIDPKQEPEEVSSAHGSVLAPHTNHEMRLMLIGTYLWAPFYTSLAGEVVVMFEENKPLGPLSVQPEIGIRPHNDMRIGFSLAVPVAGQRRLSWHGRLTVEYLF